MEPPDLIDMNTGFESDSDPPDDHVNDAYVASESGEHLVLCLDQWRVCGTSPSWIFSLPTLCCFAAAQAVILVVDLPAMLHLMRKTSD